MIAAITEHIFDDVVINGKLFVYKGSGFYNQIHDICTINNMNMKFRRYIPVLVMTVLAGMAMVSCHKDKKEEKPLAKYLSGALTFSIPSFVQPGETYTLHPSKITAGEDGPVGYFWKVTMVSSKADTVRHQSDPETVAADYLLVVPDTMGTTSITCTAFAKGYYNSTKTVTVVVVNPEKSISGAKESAAAGKFTDSRDNREYAYATIGNLDWMTENLKYEGGRDFESSSALRSVFGGYYTWDEAVNACPEGWRLPDGNDWLDLAKSQNPEAAEAADDEFKGISGKLMVDAKFNGDRLWEFWPDVKITGASGFRALPFGYGVVKGDSVSYDGYKEYAIWWTADEYNADQAYYRYLYADKGDMFLGFGHKDGFVATVRCVR